MSGYVFHCTPCGHAHAGECPPKAVPAEPKPWQVAVTVGSHWHCEGWAALSQIWVPVGPTFGFEVMSIITNGIVKDSAVQVREWGQPTQPVATVPLKLWEPDGYDDGCGYLKRMVAWV